LVGDLLQLAVVSTFAQPITQLYKSLLFKNNFIPFILTKNMRAAKDPKYFYQKSFYPIVEFVFMILII
jgi:hypothetical protein